MKFNVSELETDISEIMRQFILNSGNEVDDNGILIQLLDTKEKKLRVEFQGTVLRISGESKVHHFRGLHLFLIEIKNRKVKEFYKEETVYFSNSGIMLDCSRNATLNKKMIQEVIQLCAMCGMDELYLYMEDVYEIQDNPYFGAYRGRYTYEDLRELDQYGIQHGVELIPAIQTLAHLHTYLKWPNTKRIQDTEDILLVGDKGTKEFVEQMIHHASRPFTTNKIHVGMDEADLLGLGKYLRCNGYENRYEIMVKHLEMVKQICENEKKELMMWGDMFFRLKSPTGDYYDLSEETEFQVSPEVLNGIKIVYWDYYGHNHKSYEKNIRLHRKLNEDIQFACGGWTWNGIAPNYSKAEVTMREGLKACKSENIERAMCTFWFDNGAETPIKTYMYSAIYFAQLCYHQEINIVELNNWLEYLTGYTKEDFFLLDAFDTLEGTKKDNENADNPSKYFLYQDILVGLFDGQIESLSYDVDEYYLELAAKIQDTIIRKGENEMTSIFLYYYKLAMVLSKKSMFGVRIRKAYQQGDRECLMAIKQEIVECQERMIDLKEQREILWFQECRAFGFEILDIRMGGVFTRMESAEKRLLHYLTGRVNQIEELEETSIIYCEDSEDSSHKLCAGGFWQTMISAGNMAGI